MQPRTLPRAGHGLCLKDTKALFALETGSALTARQSKMVEPDFFDIVTTPHRHLRHLGHLGLGQRGVPELQRLKNRNFRNRWAEYL